LFNPVFVDVTFTLLQCGIVLTKAMGVNEIFFLAGIIYPFADPLNFIFFFPGLSLTNKIK